MGMLAHHSCYLSISGKKRICKHQSGHEVQGVVVVVKSGGRRERLANVVETDVLALQSTKHFYILDTKESKVNIVREKERERERDQSGNRNSPSPI